MNKELPTIISAQPGYEMADFDIDDSGGLEIKWMSIIAWSLTWEDNDWYAGPIGIERAHEVCEIFPLVRYPNGRIKALHMDVANRFNFRSRDDVIKFVRECWNIEQMQKALEAETRP